MFLTNKCISTSCKLIRTYFHPSIIISEFKDICGDINLDNFPEMKKLDEKLASEELLKINIKSLDEMKLYFQEKQEYFFDFLKGLINTGLASEFMFERDVDIFIVDINKILIKSQVKIENHDSIMFLLPNKAKEIFINKNTPDIVLDYFLEALECFANNLHRSSILFCIFALEASLRIKYAKMVSKKNAYKINFHDLIKWGQKQKLVERSEFDSSNIASLIKYRNDLAHLNLNKVSNEKKISRNYAEKMSEIIINMVKLFINSIFTEV